MLLNLQDITFEFGAHALIKKSSWAIMPSERIGLIGANGAGKSTLLKIIHGDININAGTIHRSKTLTIGYFHQDLQSLDTEESIWKVAMSAYEKAMAVEKEIAILEQKLHAKHDEKQSEYLAELYHLYELEGGYEMKYKSAEVLEGLGFKTADLERPFKEFSGGWRIRVLLAKMILQNPDILLLDEPTNHLDLPSIEWFEKYLQSYPGTIIIVSHDRFFLDRMVQKIVEIDNQTIQIYSGNYTFYQQEKEIRNEFRKRAYENQQDYIQQQEKFVERFRYKASKAKQAQSIIKRLEKLEIIDVPESEKATIHFRFVQDVVPGKILATLKDIDKAYGDIKILKNAHAEIVRGDKIALVGANGKGKSTLLRLVSQTEPPDKGTVIPGHNVHTAFYAQHQIEVLNLQNDILQELSGCGSGKTELELRELMGCFLFKGDDIFKKIRILSGGEKARIALAKTIISKANFMLLDEPTNHLDIQSVNMLIQAINQYEGTCLIVSHDRYFIQNTATKIWEIEDGIIKEFNGGYDEWDLYKKNIVKDKVVVVEKQEEKITNNKRFSEQKVKSKEEKKLRGQFEKMETELHQLQKMKSDLEQLLSLPETYSDKLKFQETENKYNQLTLELEKQQAAYELLFEKLLEIEN